MTANPRREAAPLDAAAAADRLEAALAKLDRFARVFLGSDGWAMAGEYALTGAEAEAVVAGFRAAVERAETAERQLEESMSQSERAIEVGNAATVGWHAEMDARAAAERRLAELQQALERSDDALDWASASVVTLLAGHPHRSIPELHAYIDKTRAQTRAALAGSVVEPAQDEAPASGRGEEA